MTQPPAKHVSLRLTIDALVIAVPVAIMIGIWIWIAP